MPGVKSETPARGRARPGRENRYATAAGRLRVAQKLDDEIVLYSFCIAGTKGLLCYPTLSGKDAQVLLSIGLAGKQGCIVSREQWPLWAAALQKLRERYGLSISEWHCKGGGSTPRGSRLCVLEADFFHWHATHHTRGELAEILAAEGGAQ